MNRPAGVMMQVWFVMQTNNNPFEPSQSVVSVHSSEEKASKVSNEMKGHTWVDGPFEVKE